MLIFRQLYDNTSSTYTYILGDSVSRQAVIIDSVFEQFRRDAALLRELDLQLVSIVDTHVHADHVTGAWLLKTRTGAEICIAESAGTRHVDRPLRDGDRIAFGSRYLTVMSTPGHTDGCLTFVLDDQMMAFTGDALLIRGCGRTDFQQGNAAALFHSIKNKIFALPASCLLYPAHDYRGVTVSSVAEEQTFNPRLGGEASESDFTGYMAQLGLPHPKLIDIAVPANLNSGKPDSGDAMPKEPDWAPLTFTFGGIWEIAPEVLDERRHSVQMVDVRETKEIDESLGRIPDTRLIPLSDLNGRLNELDRTRPVVTICRSGARSAQATVLLQRAGFQQVANLSGGMLRWRSQGFDVLGTAI